MHRQERLQALPGSQDDQPVAILAAYTLACFALPVIMIRWRDIL